MRFSLSVFLLTLSFAHAGTNWTKYELQLRRRAEILSQRSLERNLILMGIHPETCQKVTDPAQLALLLQKQIQDLRTIGELNHCDHLTTQPLLQLNTELVEYWIPDFQPGMNDKETIKGSGKKLSQDFDAPFEIHSSGQERKHAENIFKELSPTQFAGHTMSSEGMHALRVFYGREEILPPVKNFPATYPREGNEVFHNYPECRIIISGGIEYTASVLSDVRDGGQNIACAEACEIKLQHMLSEKNAATYLMTCHHLGELVSIRSKGSPAEQGIKRAKPNESDKCVVRVRGAETLLSEMVAYKAECLGYFKDAFLKFERKSSLLSGATIDAFLVHPDTKEELIASSPVRSFSFEDPIKGQCQADAILLLRNGDRIAASENASSGDCLTWCQQDFKNLRSQKPIPGQTRTAYEGLVLDWHYRCSDISGSILMQCHKGSLRGCQW